MPEPLNPILYRQLQRHFVSVKIANEGQAMVARYAKPFLSTDGHESLQVENRGECYCVCCDRCNDTRHRLWINHMWGRQDDRGRRNLWLAICYNENCYNYEQSCELLEKLEEPGVLLRTARINEGIEVHESPDVTLPGPHFLLHNLPREHTACRYLAGRFFDPERLGKFYRVGYCPNSDFYLAKNRIIAPIYFLGKLKGFQSRYIGDLDWKAEDVPPKWWTDPRMRRNMVLYNYDNAIRYSTGVIVEGPSSNWGIGPMGLATLGSSMSLTQARHLVTGFRGQSLVLLWDPDVQHSPSKMKHVNEKVIPWLTQDGIINGLAVVWTPSGTDPGSLDRGWLRRYIEKEAKAQGVKVSWALR